MKSIKFSDSELNFMCELYEVELEVTREHLVKVEEILKKLGSPTKPSIDVLPEKEIKVAKKPGRKPGKKVVVDTPVVKKRRGRRPKAESVSTEIKSEPKKEVPALKNETKELPVRKLKTRRSKANAEMKEPVNNKEELSAPQKETNKPVSKKVSKRRPRGSVVLAPLSKPLKKKKTAIEPPTKPETLSENPTE